MVAVPDLTRRARGDASALLAPLGLVPDFETAATTAPDTVPGTVVRQIPEPGASVSSGTAVRVVLAPDGALVPNLSGLAQPAVEQALASRGIRPQFVMDATPSPGVAPGSVVRQVPPAGTLVGPGGTIQVVLAPVAQSPGSGDGESDWWWRLLLVAAIVAAVVAFFTFASHRAGKGGRGGAEAPPPAVTLPPGSPPPPGLQIESHTGDVVTRLDLGGPSLIAFKVSIRTVVDGGDATLSVNGPLCRDVRRDV